MLYFPQRQAEGKQKGAQHPLAVGRVLRCKGKFCLRKSLFYAAHILFVSGRLSCRLPQIRGFVRRYYPLADEAVPESLLSLTSWRGGSVALVGVVSHAPASSNLCLFFRKVSLL